MLHARGRPRSRIVSPWDSGGSEVDVAGHSGGGHAIFHDHNGDYSETKDGKPIYNWSYVDQIDDGLLDIGVRPFVELSFMPSALAASQKPHPFWYKPLPNPPNSYEKWGSLVGAFTRHVVERYGIDEISQWYFEDWNEPNIDFWTGKPAKDTYSPALGERRELIYPRPKTSVIRSSTYVQIT